MPLPHLDNTSFATLIEEARARIPRETRHWIDFNISDPGITFIELFAWLAEMAVYRLNQVPPRHLYKFLSLIGFNPLGPSASHTVLSFSPDAGAESFTLPKGVEFEAATSGQSDVRFRTTRDVDLSDVALAKLQVGLGNSDIRDLTQDWRDRLPIAPFSTDPQLGAALYLGFRRLPTETPIALALHFEGPGSGLAERQRILSEAEAQRLACLPVLPDIDCDEEPPSTGPATVRLPAHHSAVVAWEVLTSNVTDPWVSLDPIDEGRPEAGQVFDDTRSLTLDGIVEFSLPLSIAETILVPGQESLFYVRCRLESGAYDAPPILVDVAANGVTAEQVVPSTQTFVVASDATIIGTEPTPPTPAILGLALDAEGVIHELSFLDPETAVEAPELFVWDYEPPAPASMGQVTLDSVHVGLGNGQPDQSFTLPDAPVRKGRMSVFSISNGDWQTWSEKQDLDSSNRTDFHYVLNATDGSLLFGNGENGRVVPGGADLFARYEVTKAQAGNVDRHSVTRLSESLLNDVLLADLPASAREQLSEIVTNRLPATGGKAEETLSEVTGRAIETLHAHQRILDVCDEARCVSLDQVDRKRVTPLPVPTRGVNLLDIERLALQVPGTRIARVRAWANHHPDFACLTAPGIVTVAVVPHLPLGEPQPSEGLLGTVRRYLDRRRIITTRIEVVGPTYLEVSVTARVRAKPHVPRIKLHDEIVAALDRFLDPLHGGPVGMGWEFGRDVYRTEILELIVDVHGVDCVLDLSLRAADGELLCGNIPLCPTWLVSPGAHEVDVE